jgi:uncharacterized OsmC-like protein
MEKIRSAVGKLRETLAGTPGQTGQDSTATATLKDGLYFDVVGPRGEVRTDMPPAVGGDATGFPPGWLLRAGLASCTGSVIAMRAASVGVKLDTLEVTVTSESDIRGMIGVDDKVSAGLRGLKMHVKIAAANASEEQLREIVQWADAHSPVASTLRESPKLRLEIDVV